MSRLCPIKPLLRQLGDNAYRASPALISGEPRELPYIALGAAHSLLQCVSPDVALPRRNKLAARLPLSAEHLSCSGHHRNADLSSRPEELHHRALPEPCMTLSSHTAPDVRPLP